MIEKNNLSLNDNAAKLNNSSGISSTKSAPQTNTLDTNIAAAANHAHKRSILSRALSSCISFFKHKNEEQDVAEVAKSINDRALANDSSFAALNNDELNKAKKSMAITPCRTFKTEEISKFIALNTIYLDDGNKKLTSTKEHKQQHDSHSKTLEDMPFACFESLLAMADAKHAAKIQGEQSTQTSATLEATHEGLTLSDEADYVTHSDVDPALAAALEDVLAKVVPVEVDLTKFYEGEDGDDGHEEDVVSDDLSSASEALSAIDGTAEAKEEAQAIEVSSSSPSEALSSTDDTTEAKEEAQAVDASAMPSEALTAIESTDEAKEEAQAVEVSPSSPSEALTAIDSITEAKEEAHTVEASAMPSEALTAIDSITEAKEEAQAIEDSSLSSSSEALSAIDATAEAKEEAQPVEEPASPSEALTATDDTAESNEEAPVSDDSYANETEVEANNEALSSSDALTSIEGTAEAKEEAQAVENASLSSSSEALSSSAPSVGLPAPVFSHEPCIAVCRAPFKLILADAEHGCMMVMQGTALADQCPELTQDCLAAIINFEEFKEHGFPDELKAKLTAIDFKDEFLWQVPLNNDLSYYLLRSGITAEDDFMGLLNKLHVNCYFDMLDHVATCIEAYENGFDSQRLVNNVECESSRNIILADEKLIKSNKLATTPYIGINFSNLVAAFLQHDTLKQDLWACAFDLTAPDNEVLADEEYELLTNMFMPMIIRQEQFYEYLSLENFGFRIFLASDNKALTSDYRSLSAYVHYKHTLYVKALHESLVKANDIIKTMLKDFSVVVMARPTNVESLFELEARSTMLNNSTLTVVKQTEHPQDGLELLLVHPIGPSDIKDCYFAKFLENFRYHISKKEWPNKSRISQAITKLTSKLDLEAQEDLFASALYKSVVAFDDDQYDIDLLDLSFLTSCYDFTHLERVNGELRPYEEPYCAQLPLASLIEISTTEESFDYVDDVELPGGIEDETQGHAYDHAHGHSQASSSQESSLNHESALKSDANKAKTPATKLSDLAVKATQAASDGCEVKVKAKAKAKGNVKSKHGKKTKGSKHTVVAKKSISLTYNLDGGKIVHDGLANPHKRAFEELNDSFDELVFDDKGNFIGLKTEGPAQSHRKVTPYKKMRMLRALNAHDKALIEQHDRNFGKSLLIAKTLKHQGSVSNLTRELNEAHEANKLKGNNNQPKASKASDSQGATKADVGFEGKSEDAP